MANVISLFSGVGGIDLAFERAGFYIKLANEIDSKACETYNANFSHKIICDDVKNLDTKTLGRADIVAGGFPCQAFSIAGYQKGFEDERGTLIFELLRIVKDVQPRIIFLENVKNLITHNKGATFENIRKHIEVLGYKIKYKVLNTCLYSQIPQNRERVYIVCFKNSEDCDKFAFPQQETKTLKITELLEKNVDKKYYYNNTKYYNILKQDITKKDTVYQWRRHYVRENKNKLCPTLTANMGMGGHNVPLVLDDDIRKLTPRECFRFQGFPDSFVLPSNLSDATLYKQIGNSVSVPVIEKIAKEIYKLF